MDWKKLMEEATKPPRKDTNVKKGKIVISNKDICRLCKQELSKCCC